MHHHLILRVVTKLLVAPIIMFGLYVQFHGDFSPGGGFQAGVIFAAAFILYGIVFGLDLVREVLPPWVVHRLMALGVLIYAGVGIATMLLGYSFLDYNALGWKYPVQGQHLGIIVIELGVGVAVAGVMVSVYYAFAGRMTQIKDKDW